MVPDSWERVYVFGPYPPAAMVARCVGSTTRGLSRGIEDRDDATLLVFWSSGGRVQSVAVSRQAGDLAPEAVTAWYDRTEAVFLVRQPLAGSWGNLTPRGGVTNRRS